MFQWLSKHGLPTGFRVLCHNCNSAHGYYGYCPHDVGEKLEAAVLHHEANRRKTAGETHGNARLRVVDVKEIKRRLRAGEQVVKLAKRFDVCKATISHIRTGRIWKHVA